MNDATLFTAMYVSQFMGLLKDSISESIREEFKQFVNTPKTEYDELLTIEQTAKLLHVSKVTIHKWKKQRLIPFHRIGRRIMFKKKELIEAFKSSTLKKKNL